MRQDVCFSKTRPLCIYKEECVRSVGTESPMLEIQHTVKLPSIDIIFTERYSKTLWVITYSAPNPDVALRCNNANSSLRTVGLEEQAYCFLFMINSLDCFQQFSRCWLLPTTNHSTEAMDRDRDSSCLSRGDVFTDMLTDVAACVMETTVTSTSATDLAGFNGQWTINNLKCSVHNSTLDKWLNHILVRVEIMRERWVHKPHCV